MLDSNPVKIVNLIAAFLTIGTAVGGVFTGIQWKGDEWGQALAATVFGFGFAVTSLIFMFLVVWSYALLGRLRRSCPVCRGRGVVKSGFNELIQPTCSVCPKCGGEGLIW
jgi:hypothetical protein